MKRILSLLLVVLLLVACSSPAQPTPAEPVETDQPAETGVSPVTPVDGHDHDHDHVGEVLSEETFQAVLAAATEQPMNIEYVDQTTGTAYGTKLVDEDIVLYRLGEGEPEELYRVAMTTEWVDVKTMVGDQLVVLERNPRTEDGRVFLLDVNTKQDTTIIGDKVYHGPVTSDFIVRGDKIYFAYDENAIDVALVSYDVGQNELTTEVPNAFDPKEHQGEIYFLQAEAGKISLQKMTDEGEIEMVVEPGLNLYDYFFLGERLDLLVFTISQGDEFTYFRIKDFFGDGSMNEFPYIKPIVWGDDVLIATTEHQTIYEHDDHLHTFPEASYVGVDTYFTLETDTAYYFTTVSPEGNRFYAIDKTTFSEVLAH